VTACGLTDDEIDRLAEIFADAALDALWSEHLAAEAARTAEAAAAS
jgi:hypothetical protein